VGPREDDFEPRLQEEPISDQNGGLNKSPEKNNAVSENTLITEQSENEPKKETKLETKNKKNIGSFFSGMFGKKPLVCSGGSLSDTNSTLDVSGTGDGNPLVVAASSVGRDQHTLERNGDNVSESPEHAADGDESNASASVTAASENNSSEEVPESDGDTTINDNSASTTESEKKQPAKKVSFFRQFSRDISEAPPPAKEGGGSLRSFFGKKKTTAKLELEESEESLPVSEEEDEGKPEGSEEEQRPEVDGEASKGLDMSGR
jgi:hypothetical protein